MTQDPCSCFIPKYSLWKAEYPQYPPCPLVADQGILKDPDIRLCRCRAAFNWLLNMISHRGRQRKLFVVFLAEVCTCYQSA